MTLPTRRSLLTGFAATFVGRILFRGTPANPLLAQRSSTLAAASEPQRFRFTDIASRSVFPYRTNNDFRGRKYFPQPMCCGHAAFDYDNDGRMDLFFANEATLPGLEKSSPTFENCLLHNRGDGTFEDVTTRTGLGGASLGFSFGVAAADYDNDGYDDLFVCNLGRNALYHNNGEGTFTDVTSGSGLEHKPPNVLSVGAAWFTNYTVWTPETDLRCKMDDKHDEYCSPTVYKSVPSRLYRNLGAGRFEGVTESTGIGKVLGKGMGYCHRRFQR